MTSVNDIKLNNLKENTGLVKFPIYADKLYKELKKMTQNRQITAANITSICLNLMMIVETFPELKGPEKKLVVLETLEKFIREEIKDKEEADNLVLLVQMTLPSVIDAFVSIDKKKLQIHTEKCLKKCFPCCF